MGKSLNGKELGTGMRIGELSGLQWEDVDFKNRVVHVRHSMTYFSKEGKYTFELHPTKTNGSLLRIVRTYTITTYHRLIYAC